jgi:hypothetical protein
MVSYLSILLTNSLLKFTILLFSRIQRLRSYSLSQHNFIASPNGTEELLGILCSLSFLVVTVSIFLSIVDNRPKKLSIISIIECTITDTTRMKSSRRYYPFSWEQCSNTTNEISVS